MPLPRGYIHVYDHSFQTSLKPHGQSKPNFMWSLLGKREHKFCKTGLGNIAKMAAMPIYDQSLYKSSSEPKVT